MLPPVISDIVEMWLQTFRNAFRSGISSYDSNDRVLVIFETRCPWCAVDSEHDVARLADRT